MAGISLAAEQEWEGWGERGAGSAEEGAAVLKYKKAPVLPLRASIPRPLPPPVWSDNLALSTAAEQALNPHPSTRSHSVGISQSLWP